MKMRKNRERISKKRSGWRRGVREREVRLETERVERSEEEARV